MLEYCPPYDFRGSTFIDAVSRKLGAVFVAEIIERGPEFEIVISTFDAAGKQLFERIVVEDLRFSVSTALDALDRAAEAYSAAR